jgi:hypothetical protein
MSIKDIPEKIKGLWVAWAVPLVSKIKEGLDVKKDIFVVLCIILIGLAGFGLGKLSALERGREPVTIKPARFIVSTSTPSSVNKAENITEQAQSVPMSAAAMIAGESAQGLLVASKSGQKYHFPWCAGASQIADKNKIWFNSYDEAQKAGYTPASNCKGLE